MHGAFSVQASLYQQVQNARDSSKMKSHVLRSGQDDNAVEDEDDVDMQEDSELSVGDEFSQEGFTQGFVPGHYSFRPFAGTHTRKALGSQGQGGQNSRGQGGQFMGHGDPRSKGAQRAWSGRPKYPLSQSAKQNPPRTSKSEGQGGHHENRGPAPTSSSGGSNSAISQSESKTPMVAGGGVHHGGAEPHLQRCVGRLAFSKFGH